LCRATKWRSVKYEDIYLRAYENGRGLQAGLTRYFDFYNRRRIHQSHDYLDTIPYPGDIGVNQLARVFGDVASLAWKWNKPLSARLQPIAGEKSRRS